MRGSVKQVASWIKGERSPPELQFPLKPDPICGPDVDAVGDRMGSHHGFPSFMLTLTEFGFIGW
jgi:hypothetical protein